ncbi:CoA transferase [Pyruvatibacter mobilis]|uniref:CoA transferase n=1 Tax=Pyruvatibacter mobilis TaxID=1712261 RepID=A0A845QBS8_9HYPH|nr:CaiB/BaiF CoA-transferase family protein [Pyruvatibacter mobilis]NBG96022.1 CoA transferase [Pyruvatibacter mobilis]QJD75143.1 CoA transferase [Pyruvatibacter mobilis]GGD13129.1 alpha-methylacyl-CoA racemase [Pyruvatibacter mobilis]
MGKGPLSGVKVLEFAGIGPGPFCAMLLSDMGADVIRIDRKGAQGGSKFDITARGRKSIALDLKNPDAIETVLKLVEKADVLQEGFRPGVMERLGLGPDVVLKRNPKIVYGRMTGWGQEGPLALAAGHDINYISLTGALHAIGPKEGKPVPPLNLVGDFGGGALYLAMGMLAALLSARDTGKGQVVDTAMTDGATSLMSMFFGFMASGMWEDDRYRNMLDGGAHFYDTYECSDGKFISIGSIEPQFYALLREKAGLDDAAYDAQMDKSKWPELKDKIAAVFKTKSRDEWCGIMEGTDICFAPVLSIGEAKDHPHNKARETIVEIDGVVQPNVAPRFFGTPSEIQGPPPSAGGDTDAVLGEFGFSADEIAGLKDKAAI